MYKAYAKINIGLRVLDKRPDGYHNIETIFHRIDLFDEIRFSPSSTIQVVSTSPHAPSDETNICHKAAALLQRHLNISNGVRIAITKNIPVGAGLGGGSSDAATVLRQLPRFWNRTVSQHALSDLALQLGSDVPFFLGTTSALGKGRGELLEYFDLDIPYHMLLCNPNIHVATGWAYSRMKPDNTRSQPDLAHALVDGIHHLQQLNDELQNDFESVVFEAHPEVKEVKQTMLRCGAVFASMSGSGSSVFGFFDNRDVAEEASRLFAQQGYKIFHTRANFQPDLQDQL